jgi:hypothetical protein
VYIRYVPTSELFHHHSRGFEPHESADVALAATNHHLGRFESGDREVAGGETNGWMWHDTYVLGREVDRRYHGCVAASVVPNAVRGASEAAGLVTMIITELHPLAAVSIRVSAFNSHGESALSPPAVPSDLYRTATWAVSGISRSVLRLTLPPPPVSVVGLPSDTPALASVRAQQLSAEIALSQLQYTFGSDLRQYLSHHLNATILPVSLSSIVCD